MDDEDQDPVEVISAGEYYYRNGKHYILYDEAMEGFDQVVKNKLKISKDVVEMTKKGIANVHMVFREGVRNLSNYETPYGPLLLGIRTKVIQFKEKEDQIDVRMEYTLDVEESQMADCSLSIKVIPRQSERFAL